MTTKPTEPPQKIFQQRTLLSKKGNERYSQPEQKYTVVLVLQDNSSGQLSPPVLALYCTYLHYSTRRRRTIRSGGNIRNLLDDSAFVRSVPNGIRTRVSALKGAGPVRK